MEGTKMIDYVTIQKAKAGNLSAQTEIINYYLPIIKSFSTKEEFIQNSLIAIMNGVKIFGNNVKNKKSF